MSFDNPSDQPCFVANDKLWNKFVSTYRTIFGYPPINGGWSEAEIVQWFDITAPDLLEQARNTYTEILNELADMQEWQNRHQSGLKD
jgi:glucuronate isomerase